MILPMNRSYYPPPTAVLLAEQQTKEVSKKSTAATRNQILQQQQKEQVQVGSINNNSNINNNSKMTTMTSTLAAHGGGAGAGHGGGGGGMNHRNKNNHNDSSTAAAVDLRRVYTMPARGSGAIGGGTDREEEQGQGQATEKAEADASTQKNRKKKGRMKRPTSLKQSKSDGDASTSYPDDKYQRKDSSRNDSAGDGVATSPVSSSSNSPQSGGSSPRSGRKPTESGEIGAREASGSKQQQQKRSLKPAAAKSSSNTEGKTSSNNTSNQTKNNKQKLNPNRSKPQDVADTTSGKSTTVQARPSGVGGQRPPRPNNPKQQEQRKKNLHKVDRFGFITNMDSRGFIRSKGADSDQDDSSAVGDGDDDDSDDESKSTVGGPNLSKAQRDERRLKKWQSMMLRTGAADESDGGNSSKLKGVGAKFFGVRLPQGLNPKPVISSFSLGSPTPVSSLSLGMTPTQMYAQQKQKLSSPAGGGGGGNSQSNGKAIGDGGQSLQHLHRFSQRPKSRSKKLVRRARKGIPESLRGRVWAHLLADCGNRIDQHEGLYDRLVRETIIDDTLPHDLDTDGQHQHEQQNGESNDEGDLHSPSAINHTKSFRNLQDTIERDIHRTFPRHAMFYHQIDEEEEEDDERAQKLAAQGLCGTMESMAILGSGADAGKSGADGIDDDVVSPSGKKNHIILDATGGQASLRRVLKAYSLYDREIGYCQGMNFIAGMFLTLMPEEEAFWLLVSVMFEQPCQMRGLFGEGMRETHLVLHVAEKLIQQFLPKLAQHLDREHVHITMFATQWLLTQYTSSFKFDLVLRVWDCFLTEGWKITYRVMLALLSEHQGEILKMSFEEILAFFRELPNKIDGDTIVDAANKIQLKRKHIAKYEKEWTAQHPL